MTGFGRAEGVVNGRKVTVEVRSLNSKQLDLLLKLPALYREKDAELRTSAGERIVRGKVELTINAETEHAGKRTTFDADLIAAYHADLKAIVQRIDPSERTDLLGYVLRMPDVAHTGREELAEEEWAGVSALIDRALQAFDAFRRAEGERLRQELAVRANLVAALLEEAAALDAGRTDRTRERLRTKLADLKVEVDADRFEQELVYYLEKLDVTEEKVRLRSHCTYFLETMEKEQHQGRKLGFIAQEMGREINTLGSKANDAAIQRVVVRMKDELEKIKEQSLNVL